MRKRKGMAILLLFALFVTLFPVMLVEPEEAMALESNQVYLEGYGVVTVEYMQSGQSGTFNMISLDENKNLLVTSRNFTNTSATTSYYTTHLYFTSEPTDKNPGKLIGTNKCVSVNVTNSHDKGVKDPADDNYMLNTFIVPVVELQRVVDTLGLGPDDQVYVSQGFALRERPSSSVPWNMSHVKLGKIYTSCEAIQNAGGSRWSWSQSTHDDFEYYYDISINLKLMKYDITVNINPPAAGNVSHYSHAYAKDTTDIKAWPNEGYTFIGWTVNSGGVTLADAGSGTTTFTMPNNDVELTANFKAKEKTPVTRPPATQKPGQPTPTPTPTPKPTATPAPTPTPKPTYDYTEDGTEWYYNTDAGYTMTERMEAKKEYASDLKFSNFTELLETDKDYSTGTDSAGNWWYFIKNGTTATHVHPYLYNGKDVNTVEGINQITELVFPSTIRSGSVDYTVVSIGGYGSSYQNYYSYISPDLSIFTDIAPHGVSKQSNGGGFQFYVDCLFGILGNGVIESGRDQSSINSHNYTNYYFYNTALKKVTIPDTVTVILSGAFFGCQELTEIVGGDGIKEIHPYGFGTYLDYPRLSVYNVDGYNLRFYYNGNNCYPSISAEIRSWESSAKLSAKLNLPKFPNLKIIGMEAFAFRYNLFDVVLPASISEIGDNAFVATRLNSITIPTKSTYIIGSFGTLGTNNFNAHSTDKEHLTLIKTVPDSTAMDYGFNYSGYYRVQAGYEVTYHSNTSPVDSFTVLSRNMEQTSTGFKYSDTLYDNVFSNPGYEFAGWNTKANGSGTMYQPGQEIPLTGPVTVYAQWKAPKNIVRYAPNGGSGIMAEDEYDASVTRVTLKANTFTRLGYEFNGWNTKADGTGTAYGDKATITIPAGTTTVYAQWKPISYVLKVSKDDIRVTPASYSQTVTLSVNQTFTVPAALADKSYTITFDRNYQSSMSTPPTLTKSSASASLAFYGWRLYELLSDGSYKYLDAYEPGEVIKNLTSTKNATLVLFPYWGGTASYVKLSEATCTGYDLVGFTTGKAYAPDYFNTEDKLFAAIESNTLIMAPNGSGAQYQPKKSETLYAYYQAKEYNVELIAVDKNADPGEITHTQTEVTMTFDKTLPSVAIPYSDRHIFMGYYDKLDSDGYPAAGAKQYYNETGTALCKWQAADVNVTTLYAYLLSEVEVTLDGRGATEQTQTKVTMTYNEKGPTVVPPKKTGYTFHGYYTGTRGTGTKYFNANGTGSAVWKEKRTDTLYAYWIQDKVVVPGQDPENPPTVLPGESLQVEAALDSSTVHIYADDNNASTNALTDKQPYQVSDVVVDGELVVAGAIPSTENVTLRAKMGTWMFSGTLERVSGEEYVRMHVTVPYRTQYENPSDESLIISGRQTKTVDILVPRVWSYWMLKEGGIYFPDKVTVENNALEAGSIDVPVTWSDTGAVPKPDYRVTAYGAKENHVSFAGYDADGTPSLSISITEEQYIISDKPGVAPDVTEHLTNVCHNAAWKNTTQFTVKSDNISVAGLTVLSDGVNADGTGNAPNGSAVSQLKDKIAESAYTQTYQSGIPLLATAENGRYETTATISYKAAAANVGSTASKETPAVKVNEINVHTPVVCMPMISANQEEWYQGEEIPEGCTILVLDRDGKQPMFELQIGNEGWHSDKTGYGERQYEMFLAQKDGAVRNEVCFPFPVWIDIGNDKDRSNDVPLQQEEWYTMGTVCQSFYLPTETEEGVHKIRFRSVAVNGEGREHRTEKDKNSQPANYVAVGELNIFVTGRVYDFTVYNVEGSLPWERVDVLQLTVGKKDKGASEWDTLPLRAGVHPLYRNLGGFERGGTVKFAVTSVGNSFGDTATCTIVPHFRLLTEGGYKRIEVYYEENTGKGIFLRRWDRAGKAWNLTTVKEIEAGVWEWQGSFSLPENFYLAEPGMDVFEYQRKFGLSFTEDFWIERVTVMLSFAFTVQNDRGEILYYGLIPDNVTNNIWKREAGEDYRYDSKGNRYEIQGGEVAVIYPGASSGNGYTTNGIY